ncbi:hypothetical protein QCA50_010721 [Cerrena zonata]|uniref:DNA/pantothenate metabolism flavoprotein C-terminal domain-containing protein n=1 Tax=Cerrena zonata TaxID=2478898 RepID=A0AAW0G6H8_9APHY
MDQVPKIIEPLVDEWTKEGFIVSFKLETDQALLIPKAQGALQRYGHQVVIGNDLHRRKFEVVFVSPNPKSSAADNAKLTFVETWIKIDLALEPHREIEEDIVAELVKRHAAWIQ